MFEPQPFERSKHVYRCDAFSELLKDAVRFFHGTPVCAFPPKGRFVGAGVYALYYIGKAEPSGWRQSRSTENEKTGGKLFDRLCQHARSVASARNLDVADFTCRLMILEGPVVAMIASVEAALIAMHRPLWNSVIDGFGNHNPGKKRFSGMMTQWDALHPGRAWAKKMSGDVPDVKMLNRRVKDYLVGTR